MVAFNRRYVAATALGFGMAFVYAAMPPPIPVAAQVVQLVKVDVAAVSKGFRAKKLLGSTVSNDKKDSIGSLDDIVIDEKKQIFAVLQVGGFLKLGGHLVAVPYHSLRISDDGKRIELPGASREALTELIEFHYPN